MKKHLLILSTIFGLSLSAQITVTDADFISGNDSIYYTSGNDLNVDGTLTGANYSWDYSNNTGASQKIVVHLPMSAASLSYQFTYSAADYFTDNVTMPIDISLIGTLLGMSIDDLVGFFKKDASELTLLGYGASISGFNAPMQMDTTDTYYAFPMTYGDTWSGPSYFNLDMNPLQDFIYISHAFRSSEVTGWGSITTPFVTYNDVIKVKHVVTANDSIRIDLGFGGGPMWVAVPERVTTTYEWIAIGEGGPVMVIKEDGIGGQSQVSEVYYLDAYNPTLSTEDINKENNGITLYPNPTANQVNINTELEVLNSKLYSTDGKLVKEFGAITELNITSIPKGKYILHVYCKEGYFVKGLIKE